MNTLHTVDPKSGSDRLIEATVQDLERDLVHPIIRVYVYVGQEADAGWEAALTACGWLAGVKPYLAEDIALVRKWVPAGSPKGIVFGTDDQPDTLLDEAEAAIEKIVRKANAEAP
jgi:hypothetical protein